MHTGAYAPPAIPMDIATLRRDALHGLPSNSARAKLWPLLLGVDSNLAIEHYTRDVEDFSQLELICSDTHQIAKDVSRSFTRLLGDLTPHQRATWWYPLRRMLIWLCTRNPPVSYFQGLHDIASIFLVVCGEPVGAACVHSLVSHHLHSFAFSDTTPAPAAGVAQSPRPSFGRSLLAVHALIPALIGLASKAPSLRSAPTIRHMRVADVDAASVRARLVRWMNGSDPLRAPRRHRIAGSTRSTSPAASRSRPSTTRPSTPTMTASVWDVVMALCRTFIVAVLTTAVARPMILPAAPTAVSLRATASPSHPHPPVISLGADTTGPEPPLEGQPRNEPRGALITLSLGGNDDGEADASARWLAAPSASGSPTATGSPVGSNTSTPAASRFDLGVGASVDLGGPAPSLPPVRPHPAAPVSGPARASAAAALRPPSVARPRSVRTSRRSDPVSPLAAAAAAFLSYTPFGAPQSRHARAPSLRGGVEHERLSRRQRKLAKSRDAKLRRANGAANVAPLDSTASATARPADRRGPSLRPALGDSPSRGVCPTPASAKMYVDAFASGRVALSPSGDGAQTDSSRTSWLRRLLGLPSPLPDRCDGARVVDSAARLPFAVDWILTLFAHALDGDITSSIRIVDACVAGPPIFVVYLAASAVIAAAPVAVPKAVETDANDPFSESAGVAVYAALRDVPAAIARPIHMDRSRPLVAYPPNPPPIHGRVSASSSFGSPSSSPGKSVDLVDGVSAAAPSTSLSLPDAQPPVGVWALSADAAEVLDEVITAGAPVITAPPPAAAQPAPLMEPLRTPMVTQAELAAACAAIGVPVPDWDGVVALAEALFSAISPFRLLAAVDEETRAELASCSLLRPPLARRWVPPPSM